MRRLKCWKYCFLRKLSDYFWLIVGRRGLNYIYIYIHEQLKTTLRESFPTYKSCPRSVLRPTHVAASFSWQAEVHLGGCNNYNIRLSEWGICVHFSETIAERLTIVPPHDKTNKMTCAPREDSDQPGHPLSFIRVFTVRSVHGCLGWSESLLGAQVILLVLSCIGSIITRKSNYMYLGLVH